MCMLSVDVVLQKNPINMTLHVEILNGLYRVYISYILVWHLILYFALHNFVIYYQVRTIKWQTEYEWRVPVIYRVKKSF